jgi:hypothetical protein
MWRPVVVACDGGGSGGSGGAIILFVVVVILLILASPPCRHHPSPFCHPLLFLQPTAHLPTTLPSMVDCCVGTPHLYQQLQPKLPTIVILAVVAHLRCCRPLCWGRLAGGTITLRRTLDNSDINHRNNSDQTPSKFRLIQ